MTDIDVGWSHWSTRSYDVRDPYGAVRPVEPETMRAAVLTLTRLWRASGTPSEVLRDALEAIGFLTYESGVDPAPAKHRERERQRNIRRRAEARKAT